MRFRMECNVDMSDDASYMAALTRLIAALSEVSRRLDELTPSALVAGHVDGEVYDSDGVTTGHWQVGDPVDWSPPDRLTPEEREVLTAAWALADAREQTDNAVDQILAKVRAARP